MSYYESSQWSAAAGQNSWDHQTPPPARSATSSTIPRDDAPAFSHQLEEVERAIDNLMKSGKMFNGGPGSRRESLSSPGPYRQRPSYDARAGGMTGPRPHSVAEYDGAPRGPHQHHGSNLQNFYASQRHQPSRGSNEAEQMMQAKRRMAAQRERELRNYHQEQQFNRNALADVPYNSNNSKSERTMSPGGMSEGDRRELIARQRSALYGEGPFAENPGYVDETGTPRPGAPVAPPGQSTLPAQAGQAALRGHSPLAYGYGRTPPAHPEAESHPATMESAQEVSIGADDRSRANSNSSPQSNPPGNRTMFDAPNARDSSRTSASSPGGSPPRTGPPGGKPTQTVAPIGTRPSVSGPSGNPALNKRSTTPLPSPLSQGYTTMNDENAGYNASRASIPTSAAAEAPVGLGGWPARPAGWGNKSGLGVQASVWG